MANENKKNMRIIEKKPPDSKSETTYGMLCVVAKKLNNAFYCQSLYEFHKLLAVVIQGKVLMSLAPSRRQTHPNLSSNYNGHTFTFR